MEQKMNYFTSKTCDLQQYYLNLSLAAATFWLCFLPVAPWPHIIYPHLCNCLLYILDYPHWNISTNMSPSWGMLKSPVSQDDHRKVFPERMSLISRKGAMEVDSLVKRENNHWTCEISDHCYIEVTMMAWDKHLVCLICFLMWQAWTHCQKKLLNMHIQM